MKPLQPILDMLERADNPRSKALEACKPKPAKPMTLISMEPWGTITANAGTTTLDTAMIQQYMREIQAQQMRNANSLSPLLRGGF